MTGCCWAFTFSGDWSGMALTRRTAGAGASSVHAAAVSTASAIAASALVRRPSRPILPELTIGTIICFPLLPASAFDRDDVRLDLPVHGAPPEAAGDRLGCNVGGLREPRGVARLDLVSEGRSLAVGDRRDPRGSGAAARTDRAEPGQGGEAAAAQ